MHIRGGLYAEVCKLNINYFINTVNECPVSFNNVNTVRNQDAIV